MRRDDPNNPDVSGDFEVTAGPRGRDSSEREAEELERQYSSAPGLDVKEYFKFYPDYFRDELQNLYDEKCDTEEGEYFRLNLDVPSPLVWLLLNEPNAFLLACERCIVEFKIKIKECSTGAKAAIHPDEQREVIRIKEDIECNLQGLDLKGYQTVLQRSIASMHLEMCQLVTEEEQENYKDEFLDPFIREHNWIFDNNTIRAIETRITELAAATAELFGILAEKGYFEETAAADNGGRF